jgi:hypothetical protein
MTIREILKRLPLQVRLEAMEELRKSTGFFYIDIETNCIDLSCCFVWERSRRGFSYWKNINSKFY